MVKDFFSLTIVVKLTYLPTIEVNYVKCFSPVKDNYGLCKTENKPFNWNRSNPLSLKNISILNMDNKIYMEDKNKRAPTSLNSHAVKR